MRHHPHLIEINALPYLRRFSRPHRRNAPLRSVPAAEWKRLSAAGFDLVWLMGLWRRSPAARRAALADAALLEAYGRALPGWSRNDVSGSPFAVHAYSLDPAFGDRADLAALRAILNRAGLGLIVDFIPNHLALDHGWVRRHPARFVRGTEEDARRHPERFFSPAPGTLLAHGRDPYFPPWTDTVQIDFRSRDARAALIRELVGLAGVADGVRCDMAMLALRGVFDRVWPDDDPDAPAAEFWEEAIGAVRSRRPGFLFIAEVYWGLEGDLLRLGFDYTYDKTLYDLLRNGDAGSIRRHLAAAGPRLDRGVHFIENHDEERAAAALGADRSRAAAAVIATLPGMRFFHDGQAEGRRIRLPVQLRRFPEEPSDPESEMFYRRLLAAVDSPVLHDGRWEPAAVMPADPDDGSHDNLLAWTWRREDRLRIVAVNFSGRPARGRLHLGIVPDRHRPAVLRNEMTGGDLPSIADDRGGFGLDLSPGPWEVYLLRPL